MGAIVGGVEEFAAVAETTSARRTTPRVCLIIGQLGLGGTENQVVLLASGLRQRGVEVSVVVLTSSGPREGALRAAGVPIRYIELQQPGGWRALLCLVTGLGRLTRYLYQARPDVVHAFLFHSYVMGAPAARLARIPVVIAGRRSLDDFKRTRPIALAIERLTTRMTDRLVANAVAVADCVRAGEGVPHDKISVIYNGLPPGAFVRSEPASLDTVHPVVLCVANLKRYKGHVDLLSAAALLRDRGLPCTLVLAGDGPLRAALDRRRAELDIDVRLLGARTDIDRLLARADTVVSPSLTEGMSNAVMEAMAAGRPVIGTAVGGTPELLADGRGLLVAPRDPTGLADAIEATLRNREQADRMGQAARHWSLTHLSADAMVRQHVVLYDHLLARRCAA